MKKILIGMSLLLSAHLQATNVVGISAGEFRVDESGAATYNIPIKTAPGTSGVAPKISLAYSSNNTSEGALGTGWSISGLSAISRCPQTPIQDGEILGITMTVEDRFCLDGQRLIVMDGVYGSAGSTYRTEVDSFVTVTAQGGSVESGPAYFIVENHKAGEIHYYGNVTGALPYTPNSSATSDAFVELGGTPEGSKARTWAIKAIVDIKDNYIWFNYKKDSSKGTFYVDNILYTGNFNLGDEPFAKVDFIYEPDKEPYYKGFRGYLAGGYIVHDQVLTKIKTTVDGEDYRVYDFKYENSPLIEERTLLKSVQECTDSNLTTCLAPTLFKWQRPALAGTQIIQECETEPGMEKFCRPVSTTTNYKPYDNTPSTFSSNSGMRDTGRMFDIDGDGFNDLIYVDGGNWKVKLGPHFSTAETLTSYATGSEKYFALSIDSNGNGVRELLIRKNGLWYVASYEPSNISYEVCPYGEPCETRIRETNVTVLSLALPALGYEGNAQVADVNGDGLEDIVFFDNNKLQAHINKGKGNWQQSVQLINFTASESTSFLNNGVEKQTASMKSASALDVNGDGRTDLIFKVTTDKSYCSAPRIYNKKECEGDAGAVWHEYIYTSDTLFVSSGNFLSPKYKKSFEFGNLNTLRTADFNGDGLTDIAYVSGTEWMYRLSTGTGFTDPRTMGLSTTAPNKVYERFIDLNGDGRTDILHATSSSQWKIYFSQPTPAADWISFIQRGSLGFSSGANIVFGDADGDGKLNLLTIDRSTMKKYASRVGIKEYVISDFTNSHGINTQVTYKPMTDSSVYIFQSSDNKINSDTFSPIVGGQVVSRVSTDVNEINSELKKLSVMYQYGGLLIHKKGRGSLGFQMLRTTDLQSGVITETQYSQDYELNNFAQARMPLFTSQRIGTKVISSAENILDTRLTANGGSFPYIKDSIEKSYVYGTDSVSTHISTTTTSVTYDDWGNVTNMGIEIEDIQNNAFLVTQTSNEYGLNHERKTGRLKSTTVTKSRTGKPSITRRSMFTYFNDGLLKTSTVKNGDKDVVLTTFEYDDYGNKITVSEQGHVTDTENCLVTRTSSSAYSNKGRFLDFSRNALGEQLHYKYNGLSANQFTGKLTNSTVVSPNGIETRTFIDGFGRKTQIDHPDSKVTNINLAYCNSCDSISNAYYKETTTTSGSPQSVSYFDKWGRQLAKKVQAFDGSWNITKAEYDSQGRLYRQYEPNSTEYYTEFSEYDKLGRVVSVTNPKGVITTNIYGLETHTVNELNQNSYSYQNGFGEAHYTVDNLGNEVWFDYDSYGNLLAATTIADGISTTVKSTFDSLGRKKSTDDISTGKWTYSYNDFGELYSQVSAEGNKTIFHYDLLGRKIRSYEPEEGTLCWIYGSTAQSTNKAVGKLIRTEKYEGVNANCGSGNPTVKKEFTYDALGRPEYVYTTIDSKTYIHRSQYDAYSRLSISTYPSGAGAFSTKNVYNDYGYLREVVNNKSGDMLQEIISMNERNQVTEVKYGNNVTENKSFYDGTGWFESSSVTRGSENLQSIGMTYDALGNVESRASQYGDSYGTGTGFTENYFYDDLNRLDERTISVTANIAKLPATFNRTIDYDYDGRGNFLFKTGTGYYKYNTSNPYKLDGVYANSNYTEIKYAFIYDNNGNVKTDSQRTFDYTGFNKPYAITSNDGSVSMKYGVDRQLYYKESTLIENGKSTTYKQVYVGNYEKSVRSGGEGALTEHKYHLGNIVITQRTGETEVNYLHKDHQGSVIAVTDSTGHVVTQSIYDPFGKKTDVYLANKYATFVVSKVTERGYTGHKHLSHVDIIHMNGRIYDPTLGRFVQADPFIQFPNNSQSYNRYSYVLNNPMSFTDPTGYFSFSGFLKQSYKRTMMIDGRYTAHKFTGRNPALHSIGVTALNFIPYFGPLAAAHANFDHALVNTGSLRAAFTSGATSLAISGVFYGIGQAFDASPGFWQTGGAAHIGAHALAGGVISDLQGGNFGHGFWSAGLTKAANVNGMISNGGVDYDALRVVAAAVIGGTISEITGGKFENGATTAAFAQAFNGNLNRKGTEDNPIGFKTNGSMRVKMDDGNHHWVDAKTYMENTVNEKLASQSGTTLDKYVITTDKDKAYALGAVATGLSLGRAVIPSTISAFGAYLYDPSDANAFGMVAGPLSHGASYVYRPLSEVINNFGNLTGIYSTTAPIVDNYVEKR